MTRTVRTTVDIKPPYCAISSGTDNRYPSGGEK